MSSSKKKKSLVECDRCACIVLSRDLAGHRTTCDLSDETGNDISGTIPIIRPNRSMLAKIKNLDAYNEFLAPDTLGWEKRNTILLNPETMELIGVTPRQPCTFYFPHGDGVRHIGTAWPCNQLNEMFVATTNANVRGSHLLLLIEPIVAENIVETAHIHLRPSQSVQSLYSCTHFREFLKVYLSNSFLSPLVPVEIFHYGKKHQFTLTVSPKKQLDRLSLCNDKSSFFVQSVASNCIVTIDLSTSNEPEACRHMSRFCGAEAIISNIEKFVINPTMRKKCATSIILSGVSGCGKTLLLNSIRSRLSSDAIMVSSKEELEQLLNYGTDESWTNSPVLLIDNYSDLIESIEQLAAKLCRFIDLNSDWTLILAVRDIEKIDLSLRRRFALEFELPVPSQSERESILRLYIGDEVVDRESVIKDVACKTHGYTGADLKSLCETASLCADSEDILKRYEQALKLVHPTGIRQFVLEIPDIHWSDIGGNAKLKLELEQALIWPYLYPENFKRFGIGLPSGILLYGPPGCCKTMVARAVASRSRMNFLAVKGPELFSKWVGESERAVRELFRRAKQVAPSVVFFDEIDALAAVRGAQRDSSVGDRVLAQLLTELDGLEKKGDVMVLAATNRPDRLDDALLRPGRLDLSIYVPLPDQETRTEIFMIKLRKMGVTYSTDFLTEMVELTDGYSGADIVALCEQAARIAMREYAETVEKKHFSEALKMVIPRVDHSMLKLYENFQCGARRVQTSS